MKFTKFRLSVIFLIILALFSIVGCKRDDDEEDNSNKELTSSEVYSKTQPSVVLVYNKAIDGSIISGTGFFIDNQGTFITNYHVVKDCERIIIKTMDGNVRDAVRFVSFNKEQDIAIVKADIESVPVELGDSSGIQVGEKVYSLGYPAVTVMGTEQPVFTEGIISKSSQIVNGRDYIQTTVPVTNGNSGGPLVNSKGQVVGVITASFNYDNIDWANLAIGINYAKNLEKLPEIEANLIQYYFRQEIPYTILFTNEGETYKIAYVLYGQKLVKPEDPERLGHYFEAWYDSETLKEFDFNTPIKKDYWLVPVFMEDTYTITFNTNGGNEISSVDYRYNSEVDLNKYVPEKVGYTFKGWDTSFTHMPYKVDYYYLDDNGEYQYKETISYQGTTDDVIVVPEIPKHFIDYEETRISPDGSTVVKCNVSYVTLTLNYHLNNGQEAKTDIVKLIEIDDYNVLIPLKAGYTFECWYLGEKAEEVFDKDNYAESLDNVTLDLYAKYQEETLWTHFTYDESTQAITARFLDLDSIHIPSYFLDNKVNELILNTYKKLDNVVISEGISIVRLYASVEIVNLTLPSTLTTTYGKYDLRIKYDNVYYNGNIQEWCNIYFGGYEAQPINNAENFYLKDEEGNYQTLTEITIPESIKVVKKHCFQGMKSLESITIPSNVEIIEEEAFSSCGNVKTIYLSKGIKTIGERAFSNLTSLQDVYFDGTIDDWLQIFGSSNPIKNAVNFYMKNSNDEYEELVNIEISVDIPAYAFQSFGGLETVTILDGTKSIDSYAFANCTSLKNIVFSDTVESIGDYVLQGCTSLTSITLGKNIKTISTNAFYGIKNLENIYYTGTLEDWFNLTFTTQYSNPMYYASKFYLLDENKQYQLVKDFIIPESISLITMYSLSSFKGLESITIPSSVTRIEYKAFYNCVNLKTVVMSANITNIEESTFKGCSSLTSIVIPNSVTSIGHSAFHSCSSLTSIVIPNSVTSMEQDAFAVCSKLTIKCETTSKPQGWNRYWNSNNRPVIWGYTE